MTRDTKVGALLPKAKVGSYTGWGVLGNLGEGRDGGHEAWSGDLASAQGGQGLLHKGAGVGRCQTARWTINEGREEVTSKPLLGP